MQTAEKRVIAQSPNVRAALFFSLMISVSETSWGYSALSGYLSHVGHTNAKVGFAEGMQGIFQLASALVAGQVADRVNRQRPLRWGALVGGCAICSLWLAMYAPFSQSSDLKEYWVAVLGLSMWGLFRGITMSPLDALYADSIPTTERARLQVLKFLATLVGGLCGPILAAMLFYWVGDEWSHAQLKAVISMGSGIACIPLVSLFFFEGSFRVG